MPLEPEVMLYKRKGPPMTTKRRAIMCAVLMVRFPFYQKCTEYGSRGVLDSELAKHGRGKGSEAAQWNW